MHQRVPVSQHDWFLNGQGQLSSRGAVNFCQGYVTLKICFVIQGHRRGFDVEGRHRQATQLFQNCICLVRFGAQNFYQLARNQFVGQQFLRAPPAHVDVVFLFAWGTVGAATKLFHPVSPPLRPFFLNFLVLDLLFGQPALTKQVWPAGSHLQGDNFIPGHVFVGLNQQQGFHPLGVLC